MGTGFTYAHAAALMRQLPRESRVAAKLNPDSMWSMGEHMLASLIDRADVLIWQNTEDGRKGKNRPKQIPRPKDVDKLEKRMAGTDREAIAERLGIQLEEG